MSIIEDMQLLKKGKFWLHNTFKEKWMQINS